MPDIEQDSHAVVLPRLVRVPVLGPFGRDAVVSAVEGRRQRLVIPHDGDDRRFPSGSAALGCQTPHKPYQ